MYTRATRFVPNAEELTWNLLIPRFRTGARARLRLHSDGGSPPYRLIFPVIDRGVKLAFVSEVDPTYRTWTVIDPKERSTVFTSVCGADNRGTIHALYGASTGAGRAKHKLRYARFSANSTAPETEEGLQTIKTPSDDIWMRAVTGKDIVPSGDIGDHEPAMSVNPETGNVIVLARGFTMVLAEGSILSDSIPFPVSIFSKPRIIPAGNSQFHAVVVGKIGKRRDRVFPVQYLHFSGSAWSAPVTLGYAVPTLVPYIYPSVPIYGDTAVIGLARALTVDIASENHHKAFVVWRSNNGAIGRWIEVLQQETE